MNATVKPQKKTTLKKDQLSQCLDHLLEFLKLVFFNDVVLVPKFNITITKKSLKTGVLIL